MTTAVKVFSPFKITEKEVARDLDAAVRNYFLTLIGLAKISSIHSKIKNQLSDYKSKKQIIDFRLSDPEEIKSPMELDPREVTKHVIAVRVMLRPTGNFSLAYSINLETHEVERLV